MLRPLEQGQDWEQAEAAVVEGATEAEVADITAGTAAVVEITWAEEEIGFEDAAC